MPDILPIIGPLLLAAGIGFLVARRGLMEPEQVHGLGRFLVVVAIPAVLVTSLARLDLSTVVGGRFMFSYAAVACSLGLMVWWLARRLLATSLVEATTMTLGAVIPNNIIIGYPVSYQLFGSDNLPLFVAVVLVENALFLPTALLLFEASTHGGELGRREVLTVVRRVLANPITLSVLVGIVWSVFALPIPVLIDSTLDMLGAAVSGMALFFVGASLAGARAGHFSAPVYTSVAARIVGGPLLAGAAVALIPELSAIERAGLVLFCAPPCFSILPAIAAPYGSRELGASIQVLGTALAAVTLPVVLGFVA